MTKPAKDQPPEERGQAVPRRSMSPSVLRLIKPRGPQLAEPRKPWSDLTPEEQEKRHAAMRSMKNVLNRTTSRRPGTRRSTAPVSSRDRLVRTMVDSGWTPPQPQPRRECAKPSFRPRETRRKRSSGGGRRQRAACAVGGDDPPGEPPLDAWPPFTVYRVAPGKPPAYRNQVFSRLAPDLQAEAWDAILADADSGHRFDLGGAV